MESNKDIFILDFNAGNVITHHLEYVFTFAKFLKNNNLNPILVLPSHTPNKILRESEFPIKKILLSTLYNFSIRNQIFSKLLKFCHLFLTQKQINFVYESIRIRNLKKTVIKINKLFKLYPNASIFFPSVDSMALDLLNHADFKSDIYYKLYLRIFTLDFDKSKDSDYLVKLEYILHHFDTKLVLGCETKSMIKHLRSKINYSKEIFWLPLPNIDRGLNPEITTTFGFLGGAKKRKGFEDIPVWIKKIKDSMPGSNFLVQLSPYEWPGYINTLLNLKHISGLQFLSPVLRRAEFFDSISKSYYVCFPYNSESYKYTGSSVFFYASDFLIPSIANESLGFSSDISNFNCGVLISNPEIDFSQIDFGRETRVKFSNNLQIYNSERNKRNLIYFVELVSKKTDRKL